MTVIRIPDTDPDMPAVAAHGDGTPFPLQASYEGWRICADTAEEILGVLVDGYSRLHDEQSRWHARVKIAAEAQASIQRLLNAGELFDRCTQEEEQILLHDAGVPPTVGEWRCDIPLVLITSFYQPLGNLLQPVTVAPGQIWWIDPSTAQSLLETLNGVRWLDFRTTAQSSQASRNPAYADPPAETRTGYQWRTVRTIG